MQKEILVQNFYYDLNKSIEEINDDVLRDSKPVAIGQVSCFVKDDDNIDEKVSNLIDSSFKAIDENLIENVVVLQTIACIDNEVVYKSIQKN